ncbi:transketolase, partial [mine drainage metagenome]
MSPDSPSRSSVSGRIQTKETLFMPYSPEPLSPELELQAINTLRMLSVDIVQKANSGHPGTPMGFAAPAFVLWRDYLRINPKNPDWAARDRFVLSAGHASALLYSLLHLTGFGLTLDDLNVLPPSGVSRPPATPNTITQ